MEIDVLKDLSKKKWSPATQAARDGQSSARPSLEKVRVPCSGTQSAIEAIPAY
jgi:hypothetical protein